jgi:hypothetical protein
MNEMNNEEPNIDIKTAFIGTMDDIISKLSSGSATDTKNVMLYFEEVEGVKYSFKVSVKSFIDRDKTVLHECMSFVDIFKAFKDKLATISLMNTKKSTKVLFEELVIQKLSEGNEYQFVDTNKFHLVEDSFIDWVTESFPELLQYTNPTEGNDYLRFEYEKEYDSWRVYANKDFRTTADKTITKNTKGGLVDNPTAILGKTWIEDGCSLSGNCLVKDSTINVSSKVRRSVLINSKVANGSEVFKSTLVNSKLFASDVFESNFWGVDTRQSRYSLIHALNISDAFELLCGPEKHGRLLSVYAGGVSFRPFSTRRVGSEDGLITVGTTVDGEIVIVRGCFEGSLEEFKARLDKDLGRSKLETEPYYGFVKYLHDKVAAKRYEALTPLVEKSQALFEPFEKISLLKREEFEPLYYVLCTGSAEAAKLLSEAEEATHQLIEYYEENFDD